MRPLTTAEWSATTADTADKWCSGYTGEVRFGCCTGNGLNYGGGTNTANQLAGVNATLRRDGVDWYLGEPTYLNYVFSPTGVSNAQNWFACPARDLTQGYGIKEFLVISAGGATTNTAVGWGSASAMNNDLGWRTGYAAYGAGCVQQYIDAGYSASNMAVMVGNEYNTANASFSTVFDNYTTDLGDGTTEADRYLLLCGQVYDAVKAISSSVDVYGGECADGQWSGASGVPWVLKIVETPGWTSKMDGFSNHPYWNSGANAGDRFPEFIFSSSYDFFRLWVEPYAAADGSPNFPVAITEAGWADGWVSSEAQGKEYWSRTPFLMRCIPNLRYYTMFSLENRGNNFGLFTDAAATVRKSWADAVQDAYLHIKTCTAASLYVRHGVWAVNMTVSGAQRLAIWSWNSPEDIAVTVQSTGSGTLSIETIGERPNTPDTQALSNGANAVSLTLGKTAFVLTADSTISFPDFV